MALDTKRPTNFRRAPPLPAGEAVARIGRLSCSGVARDYQEERAVTVMFSRPLTDDELRFFHDVCRRSAPLMDGA